MPDILFPGVMTDIDVILKRTQLREEDEETSAIGSLPRFLTRRRLFIANLTLSPQGKRIITIVSFKR